MYFKTVKRIAATLVSIQMLLLFCHADLLTFLSDAIGNNSKLSSNTKAGPVSGILDESVRKRYQNESLSYSLTWENLVNAGTATLSIKKQEDRFKISTVAVSAQWLRYLGIKVQDTILSESDDELTRSYKFKAKIEEGNFRKTKTIDFNHKKRELVYTDADNPPEVFPLEPGTFDVLTALFLVRTKHFEVGKSVDVNVFDDKKWYLVKTKVLKREKIIVGEKEINTYKTQVLLETSGIFNRKGDLFIWFTDDNRKIPVLIKSKIVLGSFYATLTNVEIL